MRMMNSPGSRTASAGHRPGALLALACALAGIVASLTASADEAVRIPNPDPAEGDSFGAAVAVTRSGLVAVGAPGDDTFGEDAGAVYLFRDSVRVATLSAELPSPGSRFGVALSLFDDRLLVGAPFEAGSGAVHVFELNDGADWEREAVLVPAEGIAEGSFGFAVAGDRTGIVVGAPLENAGRPQSGAVYVFEQPGEAWEQVARIVLPGTPGAFVFGSSVAIERDTIVAGAPFLRLDFVVGSAYVIERGNKGWALGQRLRSPASTARDRFGSAALIDRGRIVVGAPRDLPPPFGYFATFVRDGGSAWDAEGFNASPVPTPLDRFGGALAAEGARLLVGARAADSGGAAFTFRREAGGWEPESILQPAGLGPFDEFGASVAISDGYRVVGAPGDERDAPDSGAIYLFVRSGGS